MSSVGTWICLEKTFIRTFQVIERHCSREIQYAERQSLAVYIRPVHTRSAWFGLALLDSHWSILITVDRHKAFKDNIIWACCQAVRQAGKRSAGIIFERFVTK